jgi:hypothetical protein
MGNAATIQRAAGPFAPRGGATTGPLDLRPHASKGEHVPIDFDTGANIVTKANMNFHTLEKAP